MIEWPPLAVGAAQALATIIIATALLQQAVQIINLVVAGRVLAASHAAPSPHLWRRFLDSAPPVSLLVPAYNEARGIVESVKSLLSLQYPLFEIVVINDGSSDGTLEALTTAFELEETDRFYDLPCPCAPIRGIYGSPYQSRLIVVDKENGGKADALNAGINVSNAPVICSIDADSLLEPDALIRAVRPFIEDPQRTLAVGGTIRVVNSCRVRGGKVLEIRAPEHPLALIQAVEYLRAFLMTRLAWGQIGTMMIISGAFGLFQRRAVVDAGGYTLGTVGEDMELVIKLHRRARDAGRPYRISFVPEPVCWTEAPESLRVLGRQRSRWQRGALETFMRHRDMLFRRRYGRVGSLGLGQVLLTDVIGPIAEAAGYVLLPVMWAFGLLSWEYLLGFVAVSFALGMVMSVGALALEELELRRYPRVRDLLRLSAAALIENLGYRQLSLLWRVRGGLQWLRRKQGWGEMTRRGFGV